MSTLSCSVGAKDTICFLTFNLECSEFFPNTSFIAKHLFENKITKPKLLLVEIGYDERFLLADFYSLYNEPYIKLFKDLTFFELYSFLRIRIKTSFEWLHASFPSFSFVTNKGFLTMNQRGKYAPLHFLQHELFLKNDLKKLKYFDPRIYQKNTPNLVETKILYIYLSDLSQNAKQENVKLVYFLPNRISPENREIIMTAYNSLPDSIKFNPNSSPEFNQLMLPKNSWDLPHLNDSGARIYSKIFAEEFKKQIIDKGYLKN